MEQSRDHSIESYKVINKKSTEKTDKTSIEDITNKYFDEIAKNSSNVTTMAVNLFKLSDKSTRKSSDVASKKSSKVANKKTHNKGPVKSSEVLQKRSSKNIDYSENILSGIENVKSSTWSVTNESNVRKSNSRDLLNFRQFNTQTGLILLLIVLAVAIWYGIQNGFVKAFLPPGLRRYDSENPPASDDTTTMRYFDILPFDAEPYDPTNPAE